MKYIELIEDTRGDLVDIVYYCSAMCFTLDTAKDAYGYGWPGEIETDYYIYCQRCEVLLS